MEIVVEDISSYIKDPTKVPKALASIRDVCRARPEGYRYMPRYKSGRWDGYISLMYSMTRFPTGLLWLVEQRLKKEGYTITYDVRSQYIDRLPAYANTLSGVTLRDYQIDAINKLLLNKRGIAKMATNAGKTEVMAGIIKCLHIPKTMVLVNRKELLHQTADRFSKRIEGIKIGKIGDGIWDIGIVTVAMLQTLYSKLKDPIQDNTLLMIDECHHVSSDRTMDIISKISGSYRYGFSGTPMKYEILSDMKLIAATGDIIVDVTNSDLIDSGYSAVPTVHIMTVTDSTESGYDADFQIAYRDMIVNNEYRNSIIAEEASVADGTVLVLVNYIDHGKILNSIIPNSTFICGSDASKVRQDTLDAMRKNGKGVYIASPIFDEGVDVPAIDTIILACGGKSHVKLLQRIGRGLRKKDGNNVLHIIDFIDDTNKHLLAHSESRINTYVSEGFSTVLE